MQGGSEEFEHSGEAYSLNSLLRGAEDGLVDAVNPFSNLRDVWDKYAAVISMFISIQYAVIIIMLGTVFLKYGIAEIYRMLLSAVFVDLYGVGDRKLVRKIYEPRAVEMEPMIRHTNSLQQLSSALIIKGMYYCDISMGGMYSITCFPRVVIITLRMKICVYNYHVECI